jgi:thiaminase/transcriptional activator TenA
MSKQTFCEILRAKTDPLWLAIFEHPFVKGIGSGALEREKYIFYLKQDYLYLIEFSRVLALASTKAQQLDDMSYFAKLLNLTLNTEMELHRRTCADFGISESELEKTEPGLITTAYTNLMVKTCYEGTLKEIIAVLLPCEVGYVEIAQYLKAQVLPDNKHYREWIEIYSSKEFIDYADWLKDRLDQFSEDASTTDKNHWFNLYLVSTRLELLFFEMNWQKELWPMVVPP